MEPFQPSLHDRLGDLEASAACDLQIESSSLLLQEDPTEGCAGGGSSLVWSAKDREGMLVEAEEAAPHRVLRLGLESVQLVRAFGCEGEESSVPVWYSEQCACVSCRRAAKLCSRVSIQEIQYAGMTSSTTVTSDSELYEQSPEPVSSLSHECQQLRSLAATVKGSRGTSSHWYCILVLRFEISTDFQSLSTRFFNNSK